jgi:hypothetical protein
MSASAAANFVPSPATVARITPTAPNPHPAMVDDIRFHIGTRKSQYRVIYEKSMSIVFVIPLMILCYLLGAHSETCMAYLEIAMQHVQVLFQSVSLPTMMRGAMGGVDGGVPQSA